MERIEVCCPQSGGEEHFSGCLICGAELVYNSLGTERRCAVCGRESAGNAVCANGHYVCDECHAYGAFAAIIPELYKSREKIRCYFWTASWISPRYICTDRSIISSCRSCC